MQINRIAKQKRRMYESPPFKVDSIQSLLIKNKAAETPLYFEDMYMIVWILKGVVEIGIDTDNTFINENVAFYVKPGQLFTMDINADAKGYIISFAREFVELTEIRLSRLLHSSFFNRLGAVPIIHIWGEAITTMTSFADKMIQEQNNALDFRSDMLKGYLKIFMIYLCRQFQQENQSHFWSRKSDLVKLFYEQLEKHYASKKMVKDYAILLGVSPNYLNGIVKEISGRTASHHIQQRIVLEAKRRVLREGYTLKETAYDLGFEDPAHFSKYFKNCSGINFTNFKKGSSL